MRSVLIVGGNGFVGSTLARELRESYTVTCTYQGAYTPVRGVQWMRLGALNDKNACKAVVNKVSPEVVIYCAGSNDLLGAEQNVQKTQLAHSNGVNNVFATSDTLKAKFIYLSSDYVFSGVDGNYSETSTAIPAFQLGKAKLGAENFLRSRSLNYAIIRAAPLLGRGTLEHPSFVDQLREAALRKRKVKLPSKVMHNPVHTSMLVHAIRRLIDLDIRNKILHLGGLSKVSMSELAQGVVTRLGLDPATVEVSDSASTALPSDYSLNFTETLSLIESEPLFLERSLDLLVN
jgi:dTDP-4-dehydrorhamnose reductase